MKSKNIGILSGFVALAVILTSCATPVPGVPQ